MQEPTQIRLTQVRETLELNIDRDNATQLPLLREREKILNLLLAYLPLPYNVAEYGCGKKCNIILKKLVDFGIPAYALKRGMIMERDMSAEALAEEDFHLRKHALVVENPLYHQVDFQDDSLLQMLENEGVVVDPARSEIIAGSFVLSHKRFLQFRQARSHIFAIITFWDEEKKEPAEFVLDPTLRKEAMFRIPLIRRLLNSSEAFLFTAPMLGHFQLEASYLTKSQKWEVSRLTQKRQLSALPLEERYEVLRKLLKSDPGGVGDPARWSYANNFGSGAAYIFHNQHTLTGKGDRILPLFSRLLQARTAHSEDVLLIRNQLLELEEELGLRATMKDDARWAEESLAPLADVDKTIAYHEGLAKFKELMETGDTYRILTDIEDLDQLIGIALKLQERIESLAILSKNREGEIDAQALNPQFAKAAIETIQEMNKAGLSVFIDQVGNMHGLLLTPQQKDALQKGALSLPDITSPSICHCSHIDTVKDGGKYDGRLGVLSGIQIADIICSLDKYFHFPLLDRMKNCLMVSAFIGEEMTFTGEGVSMPGSAAVTGKARVEQVYEMVNAEGERFKEKLLAFLEILREAQDQKRITLWNDFSRSEHLLDACYACTDFFTPHTYERHIEQGPILDRWGTPLALVKTIMGIYQEDFTLKGTRAEEAALELNYRFRALAWENYRDRLRATVGIMEADPDSRELFEAGFAMSWMLQGFKNHAGATLMEDRQDPGVAAARLAGMFREKLGKTRSYAVGGLGVVPGSNRNVIPERVMCTLAVSENLPLQDRHALVESLQHFAFGTLSKPVEKGGEGLVLWNMEPIDFCQRASSVRVSLDLRGIRQEVVDDYLSEALEVFQEIEEEFQVRIQRSVEQNLAPSLLEDSGQVLQIERSYGGSHNPNEAELIKDLLRGTLLQYAISMDMTQHTLDERFNLHHLVEKHFPEEWKTEKPFVSGALHDTCNIASAF